VKVVRRFWPEAWWPDQRTLGLLIFGFFGVAAVSVLIYSGAWFSQAFGGYAPTDVRAGSGSAFVGGVADIGAALGGLALMADLSWARAVTAASVGVAAAAALVTLVVVPFGAAAPPIASLILDVAICVLVMRWQPRPVSSGRSAVDIGTEAAPQGG
jgi:hypothetical protein